MRILQLVGQSHSRGAEKFALELAHGLDALGHDNQVFALGLAFDGERDPALPSLTGRGAMGPRTIASSAWRLRRLLGREPVDVLLAHGGSAAQVAGLARRHGRPLLVWQRILGFPPALWRRPVRLRWWRTVAGWTDAVVAMTPALEDELRRLGFAGPVWVINAYNTRDPRRFAGVDRAAEAERLRREIDVPDEVPLVGFVGHFVDQKRPERTLDVIAGILARGVPAHLVLAGDGPLRRRFEDEVHARGLDEHVTLLGHRSDVERVYGGLDLLLLTSDDEGIPGVAVEAQMAGCPVVTFPVGGVGEVVKDGRTGIVLDGWDTARMTEHAVELLRRPDVRRRLGAEGRHRADEFSTRRAAEQYAARLTDLYDRRAALTQ